MEDPPSARAIGPPIAIHRIGCRMLDVGVEQEGHEENHE